MRNESIRRRVATIGAATIVAYAVACGGGGETTTSPSGGTSSPGPSTPAQAGPTIASFAATPSRITNDQTATLAWSVTGASSVSIDQGIGAVTSASSTAVHPTGTTIYTLTATNAQGASTTAAATVTVTAGVAGISLTWNPASTAKIEQVIGDKDWAAAAKGITLPTASLTASRYNIFADGFGTSFEANGKVIFMFGDTRAEDVNAVNFHAGDPIGFSTTTDGEAPLRLDFYTQSDGKTPLFIAPPGVKMGGDDIGNAGIALSDGIYIVVNTGADNTLANNHQKSYSVLVRFDEATKTFTAGRTISTLPGGHFVFTGLHALGSDVYMFGMGEYRASDIFLSTTPASGFWSGTGTRYFAGLVNGQPTWATSEAQAVPVIQDNPLNGPPWPNDSPTVGNLNVAYSADLGLWLMTYDGGRQTLNTRGVYFTYAKNLWGPWAPPQLIFNLTRDNAFGVFAHNPGATPSDGLIGPTIGENDPVTTAGAAFAPMIIERFTKVVGSTLKIYFVVSTWNPYTVVKMRSEFTIGRP